MFARLICQPRRRNGLRGAAPRCIEQCVHSLVSHFALWLDSLLRFGALKLFDEVLVKQRAAIVHVRSLALFFFYRTDDQVDQTAIEHLELARSVNGLISKSHLTGYDHLENSQWNICNRKLIDGGDHARHFRPALS